MASAIDQREAIAGALKDFASRPVADASRALFDTLGYVSDRTLPIANAKQFREQLDAGKKLTERECETLDQLASLHLLFQFTGAELDAHRDLLDDPSAVQATKIESYLFFAGELPPGQYTRTALSMLVRAINKPLPMPALVLLRHGDLLSIGIIHRRLHKRGQSKDVLEKVTLIKDIAFADPIRAHLEILNDFVKDNLDADFGVSNFVRLHEAWQNRLGAYALSNNFYREIADWYFWAHHQLDDGTIRLPQHCDTEQEQSLFLIRLLTRVIFSWFLVEKRLIPTDLFRESPLKKLLKVFNPSTDPKKPDGASSYYHAVLQNLFFGTLNMPADQRGFRGKKKDGQRYDQNYGITNLWRYETELRDRNAWEALANRVPFLNGGLFDCLDDKTGTKKDNFVLDGFSDNPKLACQLPNDLFFGAERIVDLSKDYGEEDKRTARSKRAKVRGLIEILSRYKFTIEENTPLEEEIALDPELLGKVFENLLASYNEDTRTTARKALGAFYTPREIVSYMVDEALKSYLATQVPRCKGALDDLFSNKATLKEIKPDTRDALIAAIGRVKILDPACGSGAFPMGALHRLVDLLQKLDPNNESWKRDRLAEARWQRTQLEKAGADKDQIAACDARIADIEKSFDTRFHALDFARKLYLIENSIYGVDIQPIATQIAKLRFFISLVVDQKVDVEADNLGVRPLPNLETRLVAADTLIPIEKSESDLFSGEIDKLRAELAAIRHEHFNARTPGAKRKWRDADAAKRQKIAGLLEREHAIPRDAARRLAAWDPYDQNSFAPFFDSEWMFGLPIGKVRLQGNAPATLLGNLALINEAGGQSELTASKLTEIDSGFDVVIGNPPYVSASMMSKDQKDKLKRVFEGFFTGSSDLFTYFYRAGISFLKEGGILSFISSNKFMRTGYGRPLRIQLASQAQLLQIIDFGELPVFGAGIDVAIVIVKTIERGTEIGNFVAAVIKEASDISSVEVVVRSKGNKLSARALSPEGWILESTAVRALLDRISGSGKPLGEIIDGKCYYGIKTGFNKAFVIDRAEYDHFLDQARTVKQIILPWLDGNEILRWRPNFSKQYVIAIASSSNKQWPWSGAKSEAAAERLFRDTFPSIHKHLKAWETELRQRSDQGVYWWELRACSYWAEFGKSKIVFNETSKELHAFLDEDKLCVNKTGFIIPSQENAFLLGVLNSQVLDYLYRHTFPAWGDPWKGGRVQFRRERMLDVPIPSAAEKQKKVISMFAEILGWSHRELKGERTTTQSVRDPLMLAYWERVLNGLVYELYFPAELHGAGLRLFDLVAHANLPDITAIPEPKRLPRLRTLFETLHDGAHPLRIALDKLQTLDTVRIIEGKA